MLGRNYTLVAGGNVQSQLRSIFIVFEKTT